MMSLELLCKISNILRFTTKYTLDIYVVITQTSCSSVIKYKTIIFIGIILVDIIFMKVLYFKSKFLRI